MARFAQRYWEAGKDRNGAITRPGLSSAVGAGTFGVGIAAEIIDLTAALQEAQTRYRLVADGREAAPVERAQFVVSELRDVLGWYVDDTVGAESELGAQLDHLAEVHENALSHDALAASLYDYAALARQHRSALTGLGDFDDRLVDEATEIAEALRERSAGPAAPAPSEGQREALELRNRLATLLYERMQRVRAASRFVMRRHPEVAREVSSSYARERRAAHRRRKDEPAVPATEQEVQTQ